MKSKIENWLWSYYFNSKFYQNTFFVFFSLPLKMNLIINQRFFSGGLGTLKNKKRILSIDNLLFESTKFQEVLKMEQSL